MPIRKRISRLCATLRGLCLCFQTAWVATLSEARRGLEEAHGSRRALTVATTSRISRVKPLASGPLGVSMTLVGFLTATMLAKDGQKFYDDDPISREPESQDASHVVKRKIDLFYDLMLNQFARPGQPAGPRAQNVNTIDEVPDSSWFTNRILARPVSIEEAVRGATTGTGPAAGKWTVIQRKSEGAAPGFTIRDSAGETWFVALDPKSNPEGATAVGVIASRIFWTLGYFQAEYYLSEFRREQLEIDPQATFEPPSKRIRPMKLSDLDPVLNKSARHSD